MELNPANIERITAAATIPFSAVATYGAVYVWRWRKLQPLKAALWAGMFASLMVACDLAIAVHGFQLEPEVLKLLQSGIEAALVLTAACFAAAAMYDLGGTGTTRRGAPVLLALAGGVLLCVALGSQSVLPVTLYESAAMLFCLVVYALLAVRRQFRGAGWMIAGVGLMILPAVLTATPAITFTLILPFNHSGVFNPVQMPGLICLLIGLRRSFGNLQT